MTSKNTTALRTTPGLVNGGVTSVQYFLSSLQRLPNADNLYFNLIDNYL
jgi:hypothetical protein